jgi:hypothetical protein
MQFAIWQLAKGLVTADVFPYVRFVNCLLPIACSFKKGQSANVKESSPDFLEKGENKK